MIDKRYPQNKLHQRKRTFWAVRQFRIEKQPSLKGFGLLKKMLIVAGVFILLLLGGFVYRQYVVTQFQTSYEHQFNSIKGEIDNTKKKLTEKNEKLAALNDLINKTKEQGNVKNQEKSGLEKQAENLQADIKIKEQKIQDLEKAINSLKKKN
jgi:septal ring factor EnvC (AmiA/AmiB activator)